MRKLSLIIIALTLCIATNAQLRDRWSKTAISAGDITGTDSTYYPTGSPSLISCFGRLVSFTFVVSGTDALDGVVMAGGSDDEISKAKSIKQYTFFSTSPYAITIDTTATTWRPSYDSSYYSSTIYVPNFPYVSPVFNLAKGSETDMTLDVYIKVGQ